MSSPNHDGTQDARVEEAVRLIAMMPDDEMTDLPPEVAFRLVMEQGREPEEGDAPISVPAPHKPSPHGSAIALPLPVEHEPE